MFLLILQGIEDAAQREGHSVLVGDTQHDEKREERYGLMLKRKEADGPDLSRPSHAGGSGELHPRSGAALCAGGQRLRVQPDARIGEGTVRLLLSILAGGHDAQTPESVTLPHKLVVRGSTAAIRSK